MRALPIVFLVSLMLAAAGGCSSSEESGQSCSKSDDCPRWVCNCSDGSVGSSAGCIFGKCESGPDACSSLCSGGVASYEPAPTLKGSAECTAVCGAVKAQGCTHGCVHEFCDVLAPDCEASVKAYLQCLAAKVTWDCSSGFAEPQPLGACAIDNSVCGSPADSGASDAAAD